MKFDLIATNPPFQDSLNRGKTPHKLWIEFSLRAFQAWLAEGGVLAQVSPSSFRSPNSRFLELLKTRQTDFINFDSSTYFPNVGSSFSHYVVRNAPRPAGHKTQIVADGAVFEMEFRDELVYLPNQLTIADLEIHRKVMFAGGPRLDVRWDYVTCHNIRVHDTGTLSRERTAIHVFPVLHTNRQVWWSSVQQDFAPLKKVMWSRSGYTKPFFDLGELGGTDMAYYVLVSTTEEGQWLERILNLALLRYIYMTAKWSGFGNERVFRLLPAIPTSISPTDDALFDYFELNGSERSRVRSTVE
jgi:hypothetical protein